MAAVTDLRSFNVRRPLATSMETLHAVNPIATGHCVLSRLLNDASLLDRLRHINGLVPELFLSIKCSVIVHECSGVGNRLAGLLKF